MQTKQLDQSYILNTYARQDIVLVSGKGAELFDENGKRYIDLGAGIAVNTFGTADTGWAGAVSKQANMLQHTSNYYYTAPQAELAKVLCARTGMQKVFFSNSGAEANECMIKAARKYASDRYGTARPNIITLYNSFHGRTITTLSATGQEQFHKHFGPFTPGFVHVPANDISALEETVAFGDASAIMIELVQGEGGVNVLTKEYVSRAAALAQANDMLLLIDEVQTGNGRTGSLFAYSQYNIVPDIVSTAKGIAGGLPFGATLFSARTKDVLGAGDHGSTFGGNPVCAAAALYTVNRLDDALFAGIRERSDYIVNELTGAKGVLGVSGMGLMLGVAITKRAQDVLAACANRGVLILTAKEKLRLLPPLNIAMPLLQEAISILKEEIAK